MKQTRSATRDRLSAVGRLTDRWPPPSGWVPEPVTEPVTEPVASAVTEPVAGPPSQPLGEHGGRRQVPTRAAIGALVLAVAVAIGLAAHSALGGAGTVTVAAHRPASSHTFARSMTSGMTSGVTSGVTSGMTAPSTAPGGAVAATASGVVVVDVVGHVRRPGLVRLPVGARVWDAVAAAGGVSAGAVLENLNLARVLIDGEQLRVPGPGDPPQPQPADGSAPGSTGAAGTGQVVDLNSATTTELDALPGVGPVLAGRIVAWRDQHGRFSRVEELGEVPGIGVKLLAQLRALVRV